MDMVVVMLFIMKKKGNKIKSEVILQAKYSPIDFDYLGYFFLRYNEYKRRKVDILPFGKQTLAKDLGSKVYV